MSRGRLSSSCAVWRPTNDEEGVGISLSPWESTPRGRSPNPVKACGRESMAVFPNRLVLGKVQP